MRPNLIFTSLAFVMSCMLVIGSFTSCQPKVDHAAVIKTLDSSYQAVEAAEKKFNSIDRFNTEQFFKGIKADLEYVQDNYQGEMDYDNAKLFADYRSITKLVKDFGHKHTRLKKEIQRTKKQIFDLKSALEAGATKDAAGNNFSALYVEKQCAQEKRIAEEVVTEIDEMVERLQKAQERYNKLFPDVEAAFVELGIMPESES